MFQLNSYKNKNAYAVPACQTDGWQNFRPTIKGPFTQFWKISNDHNSATRHPIPFMFGSSVGFSGSRIERRYFRLDQIGEIDEKITREEYTLDCKECNIPDGIDCDVIR